MRPCIVLIPSMDGRIDLETMKGLMQVAQLGVPFEVSVKVGNSNIQSARDALANDWLQDTAWDEAVWLDTDIGFSFSDWEILWSGSEDAVCCTYPRKSQTISAMVEWGFGFVRTHRRVFEQIADLQTDDGLEVAARYRAWGRDRIEYFPSGARVVGGQSIAEDVGFWTLAKLADASMRLETRTLLRHRGLATWSPEWADHLRPEFKTLEGGERQVGTLTES